MQAAQNADVIILCIGEDTYTEGVGNTNSLMLSDSQLSLANALVASSKPTIVIYVGGRPRIITDLVQKSTTRGVLLAFLPGNRGAEAIADILFGLTNPSAKLPITYPKYPSVHMTYDHLPLEIAWPSTFDYLFPFGHGLSYTTFEYSSLTLSTSELIASSSSTLTISVSVRNTGSRAGKEVVMLFLNDAYASVPRPVKQLKRFTKIDLNQGETKIVSFNLTIGDLSFMNEESKRVYEGGEFNVYVGNLNNKFFLNTDNSFINNSPKRIFNLINYYWLILVFLMLNL